MTSITGVEIERFMLWYLNKTERIAKLFSPRTIKKSLLYAEPETVLAPNGKDLRPHVPHSVFAFELGEARSNPLGVITLQGRTFQDSRYSVELKPKGLQSWRYVGAALLKKVVYLDVPVLVITHSFYDCFSHFYLECLVKLFLLRKHLTNGAMILMPSRQHDYHISFFTILDLGTAVLRVEENCVVHSSNLITCSFAANSTNFHSEIMKDFREWMRTKFSANFGSGRGVSPQKIFVGRPKTVRRTIVNRADVLAKCSEFGYTYIEMEDYSLEEQIEIFFNATHVAAIHGAALAHLVFAPKNCRVIELNDKDIHYPAYAKLCRALGLKYFSVECEAFGDGPREVSVLDLIVDADALARAMKLAST
jgi:hypothetical protein